MSTNASRRVMSGICGAVAVLGLAASSQAAILQLIAPAGTGTAYGSGWCDLKFGFDAQPTWDGTTLSGGGEGVTGQGDSQYYASRFSFIDFGASFADIKIYQTWTKYRKWSGGDGTTWVGGFWTSTNPGAWPSQTATPVADVGFTFESQTNLNTGNTEPWLMDTDASAAPVTPSAQYLVLQTKGPVDPTGRGEEYAILGTVGVPEPTSLAIIGLGGLSLLARRRHHVA